MADEDDSSSTPGPEKPGPSPQSAQKTPSMRRSGFGDNSSNSPLSRNLQTAEEFISSVAAKIAAQPLQYSDPEVWGVLTAISEKARKRNQGINMLLTSNEHCIGRLVDDARFQIIAPAVSANHCKIYRKKIATGVTEQQLAHCSAFLKDSSTNGTYLNWEKLNKNSFEAKLCHGDIVSIALAPHHELAFAFVYREVQKFSCVTDGGSLKRKPEEYCAENKRLKGIGIGASHGPLSLDDFRSLQRSNMELRKQLEDQVATIESLHSESRAATEKHETEMKELNESVSKSFQDQLSQLNQFLETKDKELAELNRISGEQKHGIEDLNERLSASMQSCTEANEIIASQKASISELKVLLDEERDQRREEREKARADMKMAIQRIQAEAMEELKRVSETSMRREKEQQEIINKLQETEKEKCTMVETLRFKLEDARQKLVNSDNKVRQLEGQIHQEQQASASNIKVILLLLASLDIVCYITELATCSIYFLYFAHVKRLEELEHERKRMSKELECEKAAREEAWSKVSALELEISAAMRDLDFERRRLKGARERIMLRETQLRAFYSTTEEISVLLVKQQEQLKAMQRTLEDEETNETTSNDIDLNRVDGNHTRSILRDKEEVHQSNNEAKTGFGTSPNVLGMDQAVSSSDEASVTEKHDCYSKSQEQGEETQEVEFTGAECEDANGGFGSNINAIGTAPLSCGDAIGTEQIPDTEGVGTPQLLEGGTVETEQVLETESLELQSGKNIDLNRCNTPDGDTMQVDNSSNEQETPEHAQKISQSPSRHDCEDPMEDTEGVGTVNTSDLLASEVAGSWAHSTAPSVPGENDSLDGNECVAPANDSSSVVAESQHLRSTKSEAAAARRDHERRALSEMIGIVAPDMREQFSRAVESDDRVGSERVAFNSDTKDCSDNEDGKDKDAASDAETAGSDGDVEMEGDDDTQEDSVG
ncbi:myosin heavy chain, non-muscle-like isoform X2 [Salvia splendens]|uniref:myosin heavy chain, non-muscle-like isoform X2 n=1 Tax=Salvia splendens TaxID=180675 RepID=UPI001C2532EB|nr:myosin heavy chain, non-muscle-like isoform X2 [Salvia splendens]